MKFILNELHRNITDEELLQDIRDVVIRLGLQTISSVEYVKNGKYAYSTLYTRFGNWNKVLEKAGLPQPDTTKFSKNELIQDILRVYSENNNFITCRIYKNQGGHALKTIYDYFGNWENALRESKLPLIGGSKHITNIELFEEIEYIWIRLGRQPTTTDIKNGVSKYSLNTFSRRFGSWRGALEAFVNFINIEDKNLESTEGIVDDITVKYSPNTENTSINTSSESTNRKHKKLKSNENEGSNAYFHKSRRRDFNLRERFIIMKRDNFKCCMCGRSPVTTPGLELHIDHIKPWAKGGETTIENGQTLCSDCNLGKSDLD